MERSDEHLAGQTASPTCASPSSRASDEPGRSLGGCNPPLEGPARAWGPAELRFSGPAVSLRAATHVRTRVDKFRMGLGPAELRAGLFIFCRQSSALRTAIVRR